MTVYEVRWSISVNDELVTHDHRLFSSELACRRYEAEMMAAVELLDLDEEFSMYTSDLTVEG